MNVLEFDDLEALSVHAAAAVRDLAQASIAARGVFALVLAGGKTPRRTYELLAQDQEICWDKTHIFFTDERGVDQDHPDSNYLMVSQALLSKIEIPQANVHAIRNTLI